MSGAFFRGLTLALLLTSATITGSRYLWFLVGVDVGIFVHAFMVEWRESQGASA